MKEKEVQKRFPIGKKVSRIRDGKTCLFEFYYVCDYPIWDGYEETWRIPVSGASGEYVAAVLIDKLTLCEEYEDSDAPPADTW